jgi:hypothetical protein
LDDVIDTVYRALGISDDEFESEDFATVAQGIFLGLIDSEFILAFG